MPAPLTTSDVARRLGVATWQVRRLYERGILPPARRAGLIRVFEESDLPAIESALKQAGYLKPEGVAS